jgi:solute:Na+ symporter, SSS family
LTHNRVANSRNYYFWPHLIFSSLNGIVQLMLIFAIVLYFLVTLGIGFYAARRVKNTGDFINAGRNLHPAMNAAALFALWFGSETIFGASSEFAEHGFIGVIEDPLGGVLCLLLVGLFFSRKMYRLNIYTIGDLFKARFGERIEILSSFLMILSFLGYVAAQIVALGLISQTLLDVTLTQGILMSFIIVVTYTFIGGMWAVSITDFLQSILIIAGLVAIAWYVTQIVGGVAPVLDSLTPEQKRILPENTPIDWVNWISAWLVLGFGSIVSQDIFQRVNAARSEDAAYTSSIAGGLMYLVFSMLPLYLITAIRIIDPSLLEGDLQLALPQLVLKTMPMWLQILFFGSLLSAIMSTCSGALLAPASLLSENIIKPLFNKKSANDVQDSGVTDSIDDKKLLWITRASVIMIGVVSLILAFGSQNIFDLVGEASVFGLVSIFVPFVATLFWGFQDKIGAVMSMLLGSVVWFYCAFMTETAINPLMPGFIASIIGLGIGYYLPRWMPAMARLNVYL